MKAARYLLYLLAAALFVWCVAGCNATYHALGIGTTTDNEAQDALNEEDHEATADGLEGLISPGAYRSKMAAARENKRVTIMAKERESNIDWNVIIPSILAATGIAIGAKAHGRSTANEKSIKETDDWIEKDIQPNIPTPKA